MTKLIFRHKKSRGCLLFIVNANTFTATLAWLITFIYSCYADNFCGLKLITLSRYRDSFSNRVLAPEGELLSFAPPKESSQRKGGPVAAHVLRSSHLSWDGKRGSLPLCRRAASLPHPFGLFPTNAAVLDAANGRKARYRH